MYTESIVFEHGKMLPASDSLSKFAHQCYDEPGSNLKFTLPEIDSMRDNRMLVAAAFAYIFLGNVNTVIDVNGGETPTFELHKTFGEDRFIEDEGHIKVCLVDEDKFSIANKIYILCVSVTNMYRGKAHTFRYAESDDMPGMTVDDVISMSEDAMFGKKEVFSCLPLGVEPFARYVKFNRDIESATDEYIDDLVHNFDVVDKIYAQILRMFYFHHNC